MFILVEVVSGETLLHTYQIRKLGLISLLLVEMKPQLLNDLHELKGKTLGCFCKPKICHGDILVELVNGLGE